MTIYQSLQTKTSKRIKCPDLEQPKYLTFFSHLSFQVNNFLYFVICKFSFSSDKLFPFGSTFVVKARIYFTAKQERKQAVNRLALFAGKRREVLCSIVCIWSGR